MSQPRPHDPDCWYGVEDARKRKQIQDRLAQRARSTSPLPLRLVSDTKESVPLTISPFYRKAISPATHQNAIIQFSIPRQRDPPTPPPTSASTPLQELHHHPRPHPHPRPLPPHHRRLRRPHNPYHNHLHPNHHHPTTPLNLCSPVQQRPPPRSHLRDRLTPSLSLPIPFHPNLPPPHTPPALARASTVDRSLPFGETAREHDPV
jgi:hypothetical protein